MSGADHVRRQRAFYESGAHAHLRARDGDRYAEQLCAALLAHGGLGAGDHVVELGAGFGRFTLPLLDRCAAVTAVDLSRRALDELERARDARAIAAARCTTVCTDVDQLERAALPARIDGIVAFFFLHHLPDFRATLVRLAALLPPGGRLVLVEPNRRNPLYLAQILCCPDMHWREEKGLYRISRRNLAAALTAAGLRDVRTRTAGWFPPQVINRSAAAARLERRLERVALLRPVLPFVLASGQR